MFSDCLRAELDAAGVGLTTICPGVIDTNIVATTGFHAPGTDEEKIDGRRGQIDKMFALRSYGPDKVADAIVSAVKKKKPIRPVAPEAYALYGISRRAAGAAQYRAAAGDLTATREVLWVRAAAYPFFAMSSSTANMVRVGTPVAPLGV